MFLFFFFYFLLEVLMRGLYLSAGVTLVMGVCGAAREEAWGGGRHCEGEGEGEVW